MSELSQPAKCKLCGAIVGHFALRWPPPETDGGFNQGEFARLSKAIAQHVQQRATASGPSQQMHAQALAHAAALGGNLTQAFLWRHFDLPEAANGFSEQVRGSVNHMTSKFTLTPEYAHQIAVALVKSLQEFCFAHNGGGEIEEEDGIPAVEKALLAIAARYEDGHPKAEPKQKVN